MFTTNVFSFDSSATHILFVRLFVLRGVLLSLIWFFTALFATSVSADTMNLLSLILKMFHVILLKVKCVPCLCICEYCVIWLRYNNAKNVVVVVRVVVYSLKLHSLLRVCQYHVTSFHKLFLSVFSSACLLLVCLKTSGGLLSVVNLWMKTL